MGWFSRSSSEKPLKRMSKAKTLEKSVAGDIAEDEYDEYGIADIPGTSDYVSEFKEGIDEIIELFMNGDESGGDKFGKLSFGLANLCNYRNTVFDGLVSNGMSESDADNKLKSILVEAGFSKMMLQVVSFTETKKKHGRKNI